MKQLYPLRKHLFCLSLLFCFKNSFSQNVGINSSGSAPAASAGLDVSFTDKGLLVPRVALTGTTDVTTIPSPANSLLVYNTVSAGDVTPGFYYYSTDTSSWIKLNTQFASSGTNVNYTAGSVNIGTTTSDASALLNVSSSSKGVLIPQVELTNSTTAAPVSSPTTSLLVYNTRTTGDVSAGFYYWTGTAWTRLANGNVSVSGWGTTGNSGTTSANYVGTSDAKPLYFRTNTASSGTTNRMQIESSGNVGIGLNSSTTASYKLQVGASSNPLFLSGVQNGTTATDSVLTIASGVVRKLGPLNSWSLTGNSSTTPGTNFIGTTDVQDFVIKSNNLERMRITSAGKIGIGTTIVDSAFINVNAGSITNGSTGYPTLLNVEGSKNGYLQFNVQNNSNGNSASTDIVATANNGDEETAYIDMGINSLNYSTGGNSLLNGANTAYLYANAGKMYVGNAASNQPLIFFTNSGSASDEDANGAERMRILSTGEIGINTTTVTSGVKLEVNGNIKATNVTYSSDRRLKTNIEGLRYGLKDLLSLKPVTYNWKDKNQSAQKQIGLIAQETRTIIPEVVVGDEAKENLGINYAELVPVLINAIKEQQSLIDKQQKQISEQQKQFDELKKLVEGLAKR